jgi:hypothetical protein
MSWSMQQGHGTAGILLLAQLPCQITCRKFVILRRQMEPCSPAHKHKISGKLLRPDFGAV